MIFTKKEMLSGEVSREKYYTQFVTMGHIEAVKNYIIDGDSKTPLKVWEETPLNSVEVSLMDAGETYTKEFSVNVLKQAAFILKYKAMDGVKEYTKDYFLNLNMTIPDKYIDKMAVKTIISLIKEDYIDENTEFFNINIRIPELGKIIDDSIMTA